ncbi:hypothetical protein BCF74_10646 [Knoellia remsis]|uniref:Uncharacterized protein n=1 Tax=Knoellia remsis TaxID=407159 RepID=A0A2T0UTW0_9MICO|nr:hypothetical protein [Knoellia remsis]PRY61298.1 hypothetical protein BCF74_10646 [Knoellia remsis]
MDNFVPVENPVALLGLALITLFFVVPLLRAVVQVGSGDPWRPFERNGALVPGRYFSVLRAPRPGSRTTGGLVLRWGFWGGLTVLFLFASAYNAFFR